MDAQAISKGSLDAYFVRQMRPLRQLEQFLQHTIVEVMAIHQDQLRQVVPSSVATGTAHMVMVERIEVALLVMSAVAAS